MSELAIAQEDPRGPECVAMIAALDARMLELYEPSSCHFASPETIAGSGGAFFVARLDGRAAGMIAVIPIADAIGEIKRVWTEPHARGNGVGRALLRAAEAEARARGLTALMLETGHLQPDAMALFKSEGFTERGPFGGYCDDASLIFMEKPLEQTLGATGRNSGAVA